MNNEELRSKLLSRRSIEDRGYTSPCWIWLGSTDTRYTHLGKQGGYGHIRLGGRPPRGKLHRVHVLAFKLWREVEYNDQLNVLHYCDIPACFNPDHLWQGTQRENTKDAMRKGRYRF